MDYRPRERWGATFDVSRVELIRLPVSFIFIHHNVVPVTVDPNYDMKRTEQIDIGIFGKPSYDWGVHPSGSVCEGMTNHLSPDTFGFNRNSLSIMFMGNFEYDHPSDAAMLSGRELVQTLLWYEWVTDDVEVLGHRDVFASKCPGANLYPRIQELLVPFVPPLPPPTPPTIQPPGVEDMAVLQHNGDFLLHNGKIVPLNVMVPQSVPRIPCDDRQWKFFTDTYGQPTAG